MAAVWVKPGDLSQNAVKRAGKRIADGSQSEEDEKIVQRWRDSHAYVLNTFQSTLRRWIQNDDVTLVQRLKRLSTIRDKLVTGRAADLSTMHDLAGCRLIFPDIDTLTSFRSRFHSKTTARHERVSQGKYDYLNAPKSTGYRGIHDVYRYRVAANSSGASWNGLRVEIQYRTQAQHAWATAVEISDVLDNARIKFDRGVNERRERLFALCSEVIARTHEQRYGPLQQLTDVEVLDELNAIEAELGVIARLKRLAASAVEVPKSKNLVLVFAEELEVKGFRSMKQALDYRNQVEFLNPAWDSVFVRAEKPAEVAGAFRNYFRDAEQFVRLLAAAGIPQQELGGSTT